ncbi:MAG: hypothetical protein HY080_00550 [Gammaproteobacteria bacterium]|nr:hypothetical protein [Gammaproteobacteria bacterium]
MIALILAVGLAAITCAAGEGLSHAKALHIYALLLSTAAGSYIGFAVADGRRDKIVLESMATVVFGAMAYYGMGKWPLLLVIGFATHALWHLLHQPGSLGARVKPSFALAGIVFDSIVALYIYLRILHH